MIDFTLRVNQSTYIDVRTLKNKRIRIDFSEDKSYGTFSLNISAYKARELASRLNEAANSLLEKDTCELNKSREGTLYSSCGYIALYERGEFESGNCKYCGRSISYGDSLSFKDVQNIKSRQNSSDESERK